MKDMTHGKDFWLFRFIIRAQSNFFYQPWYFPKGNFPWSTSHCENSQMATSQKFSFGLLRRRRPHLGPGAAKMGLGGRALRLGQTWTVAVWEIAQLGSFHLGNTLGNFRLGKSRWESTSHRKGTISAQKYKIFYNILWTRKFYWNLKFLSKFE